MEYIPMWKTIEKIEREIGHAYLAGCIQWVDANFDNAWSKMVDMMQKSLDAGDNAKNRARFEIVCTMYHTQAMGFIDAYKRQRADKEATGFIDALLA